MTPTPTLDARVPSSTPPTGPAAAPRSRRIDYLLTACVGLVSTPVVMILLGIASQFAAQGRTPLAALHLVLMLTACAGAQWYFAVRSSVGGLVAGLTALAAHASVLLAPQGARSAPLPWMQPLIATGALLVTTGLLLGGSWGMRRARRAGRSEARLAARLTTTDRTLGVTPPAPPPRRRAHLLSFMIAATTLVAAFALIRHGYPGGSGPTRTPAGAVAAVGALVLLIIGSSSTGMSTLGVRTTGPLLVIAGVPLLVDGAWGTSHAASLLSPWFARDPNGVGLIGAGLLLIAVGWGAHTARRRGRAEELAGIRAVEPSTPAHGITRP